MAEPSSRASSPLAAKQQQRQAEHQRAGRLGKHHEAETDGGAHVRHGRRARPDALRLAKRAALFQETR